MKQNYKRQQQSKARDIQQKKQDNCSHPTRNIAKYSTDDVYNENCTSCGKLLYTKRFYDKQKMEAMIEDLKAVGVTII